MHTLLERTIHEINRDIHWSKKAVVINIFHNAMLVNDIKWNFADSARDLNVSRAYVSESVKLAKAIQNEPELIHISRKSALRKVRL